MEILQDHAQQNGYARQVVVPSRVLAALSQLEATEQAGVRALFDAVARQGVDHAAGVGVRKLDGADPLYVLSPSLAPDVLVIARMLPDASIEVTDIVRPETLRNFLHAS